MPGAARHLLAVGTLTGVAYEIDAVTGTDFDGLPYITTVESTGTLTTASGSLPIAYNEQFSPGHATMTGTVNFTFPQTVTLGQTASLSASAQANWNNSTAWVSAGSTLDRHQRRVLDLTAWMTEGLICQRHHQCPGQLERFRACPDRSRFGSLDVGHRHG